ncbi:10169_t:CDS:2, partial [Acaulospora colombiana]
SSHTTTFSHNSTIPQTAVSSAPAAGEGRSGRGENRQGEPLPRDSDRRMDLIWSDFERVVPHLNQELQEDKREVISDTWAGISAKLGEDILPVEIDIPNLSSTLPGVTNKSLRAASQALDLLLFLSCYLTDEAKLDRLIPYTVDLLHDDSALIRAAAVRTILQVAMSAITPSNASIIPEYILQHTRHLASDPDVMVRCMYAQCLVPLTEIGALFLEMSHALKAHGTRRTGTDWEAQEELQSLIQEQLVTLLVDKSSVVKRTILNNTSTVCVGGRSLDEYILPLMIQALSDTEETVVAKVLQALTELSGFGLFQKMRIWELMSAVFGFLYHPNVWIRQAARQLPKTDVWCILYPSLKYFLKSEVKDLDEETLLTCVKPP